MTSKFLKCIDFVLEHEGGYANHPDDPGGETSFGISKKAYPTLDVKNLTKDQAKLIYYTDYWVPAGCESMDYPLCLFAFDTAVNLGQGVMKKYLAKTTFPEKFLIYRIQGYMRIVKAKPKMKVFLVGWLSRTLDLFKIIE